MPTEINKVKVSLGFPLRSEIAQSTRGRDITRLQAFIDDLIPPQDRILMDRSGGDLELYERVLEDDQVKSTMQQRVSALLSREVEILPGDERRASKKAADFIKDVIKSVDWDDITDKALYGRFYGFTMGELMYGRDGSYVTLDADRDGIRVRNRRRFGFDWKMQPKLLTWENRLTGELLPARKFWYFNCGADNHDEPYGRGLASWLYWPTLTKRTGIKKWLTYLEKYASPTVMGTYPMNAREEEKAALLDLTQQVADETGLIVPEGMVLTLLEASRGGTGDYSTLHDKMDSSITKIILSQTMTTENGSSLSQAQVHYAVRQDVVKADADLLHGSFNRQVVKWLIDYNYDNFPGAAYPKVWRRIESESDLSPIASRDRQLFDMGFRPTIEYIHKTYGDSFVDTQVHNEDTSEEQAKLPLHTILGVPATQSLLEFIATTELPYEQALQVLIQVFGLTEERAKLLLPKERPEAPPAIAPTQPAPPPNENPTDPIADEVGSQDPATEDEETSLALAAGEDVIQAFAKRLQSEASPQFERWFDRLRSLYDNSRDLDEFNTKLNEAYPGLDDAIVSRVMGEAMFASRLAGFYEAQEEPDGG